MKKLLRKKLALMLAEQKKKRPYYCEVEYLQTSGTQYIDTGLPVHFNEDTITLIAELTESKEYQTVYGVFESFDGKLQFFAVRQLSTQEKWQSVGIQLSFPAYELNKKFKLQLSKVDETYFRYLGETVYTGRVNDNKDTSFNGYLFATNNRGGVAYKAIGKIYAFQHKRNGVLIRDLIPVLDWDMRPAMYDKVSGELLYNAGKGDDFLYGREIHQVEYLESTGTQYIDTGVYFNDTTHTYEWDIDAQAINSGYTSGYNWFTGYNQNGVNSCGTYGDNSTYTFYPAGKYYQNGVVVSTPTGGDKYAPVKNTISLTNKICDHSLVLFARWVQSSDTIDAGGAKRIFSAKYYDNGELICDCVPAIDENGVGFMFDRVSHTIFDNAGTGLFKYPAVVLEYLESTGTQYINTNYKPIPATTKFELLFTPTSTTANFIFGARTDTSVGANSCTTYKPDVRIRKDWAGSSDFFTLRVNTTDKFLYTAYDNTISLNDEIYIGTVTRSTTRLSYDFALFTVDTAGTFDSRMFVGKIYYAKLWDDGVLVRDLIPALKDGQIGMYDKVNNVLYQNAGTGTFLSGKIVESGEE